MEDSDVAEIDIIISEDSVLCSNTMDMCLNLKELKEKLQTRKVEEEKPRVMFEDKTTSKTNQLQKKYANETSGACK